MVKDHIVAFRDSYLSSAVGDDNHHWVGVALNSALTKLYIEDFGDEIDVPSKEENDAMSKYVSNLRQRPRRRPLSLKRSM